MRRQKGLRNDTNKIRRISMNRKKVFLLIIVILVALLSMSSGVAGAEQGQKPEEMETVEKPVRFMFIQNATSGSLIPIEARENLYTLILKDVSPQTTFFSDRPERVVGQAPMQKFLDGLGFSRANPPNAAVEILGGEEETDLIVVELFDPVYDAANKTLRYTVSILEEPNLSYAIFNERHDKSLPKCFGPVALFIDDCNDGTFCCHKSDGTYCGNYTAGCCWHWYTGVCIPCHSDDMHYYVDKCISEYTEQCDHLHVCVGCLD